MKRRWYFLHGRLQVYVEPRDMWVGAYLAENYLYVCPLPLLVVRWERKHFWRA